MLFVWRGRLWTRISAGWASHLCSHVAVTAARTRTGSAVIGDFLAKPGRGWCQNWRGSGRPPDSSLDSGEARVPGPVGAARGESCPESAEAFDPKSKALSDWLKPLTACGPVL